MAHSPTLNVLDAPILHLPAFNGSTDAWRVRDACEGTQIFGTTGSGKTSGSGQAIAKAFLANGFGGLVLCAKVDERELWERYAAETGRSGDLAIFSPAHPWRFNFLDYERNRAGAGAGLTENIVQIFNKALELAESGTLSAAGSDPYWQRATTQLLRNAVDLLGAATGSVSLGELQKLVTSAPTSRDEVKSAAWQQDSFLYECVIKGQGNLGRLSASQQRDFVLSLDYWLSEFAGMDQRPRSSIVSSFTSMADGFLRGLMFDLFCTETTLLPEFTHEGAVIVLDLPVKEYGLVGIIAQGIFKYLWQQAVERRRVGPDTRPVFLWADESQFFANSYDMLFQTTARSARACTVYLTQNINNYYTMMGGKNPKATVDSLLGNFQTKIFHTNGDAVTNNWASEMISKSFQDQVSYGRNTGDGKNGDGSSSNVSKALHYEVQPSAFLTLRNGGPDNDKEVDAILFKAGREWHASGRPHRLVSFAQEL